MSILCLDIATATGWAIWSDDGVVSGVVNCAKQEGENEARRLLLLWHFLKATNQEFAIDHVFYEKGVSFQGYGNANGVMHRLFGVFELWSELNDIPIESVNPTTLKKFATGSGRAKKDVMMDEATRRWPSVNVFDHNQADALLILSWAMDQYGYQPS